jgi:sigma-B regulation protein RsbU (phosphoserine phosphatase)
VTTGIPLGIEGAFQWGEQTVHMAPGATLVLYSDGVTEAQNQQGDFYEEARLIASIAAAPHGMTQAILDSILCQLAGFVGGAAQADDITLLVLSREPAGASDSQQ